MIAPTQRIAVAFSGESAGVEELTWGQRTIWNAMVEQQSSLPIGGWLPLPKGTTVQDIVAELRFHMSRHESMRMRLVFGDDGRPRQSVAACGEVALEVFDAEQADPVDMAEKVKARYMNAPFDYAGEWPIRMAVILSAGVPTHVVTVLCHLVTDAAGGQAMMADLSNLDRRTGLAKAPPTASQPQQLARWQQTPAGQRLNASSLQYWEEQLRGVPSYSFGESTDKRQPRHWEGQLTSPAVRLAAQALAHQLRADTSQVLLAAYATMLAGLRRADPVVIRPIVSNRFRPGLADIVSPINEAGLCVIAVGDATFAEVVQRTRRTAMRAFKAAYYHPESLAELIAAIEKDRGEQLDLDCFFNDRRIARGSALTAFPTVAQLREAQQRHVFRWTLKQDKPFGRLFLHVDEATEIAEAVTLTIRADTHHFAPADMRACVQGIEATLVDAVRENTAAHDGGSG